MSGLLPCPFCGGRAERFSNAITNRMVNCRSCGAAAFDAKWQTRPPYVGAAAEMYEALRSARIALMAVADSALEAGFGQLADIIDQQLVAANVAIAKADGEAPDGARKDTGK